MGPFEFQTRTRLVYGTGSLELLGALARELGFRRTLVVSDRGIVEAGYVERASMCLAKEGLEAFCFHDFSSNPDEEMVERGREFAAYSEVDSIIGLGGGSSLDCAKGINLLLTNGGRMRDYRERGRATQPLLPSIGVPTTAGTGSEAQTYALISDKETHTKMACGDPQAAFRVALLDPRLTVSQSRSVTASAGFDAISHAVESYVTTRLTPVSEIFSREAWRLLDANYERVLAEPNDLEARGAMQLGAFYAGMAIENSMLGATHACANPLTARYGVEHGVSIALLLPTVVRWNATAADTRYGELLSVSKSRPSLSHGDSERLASRLEHLARAGGFQRKLGAAGVPRGDLTALAAEAALQWTGGFNPRRFDAAGALEIYEHAYGD